MGEPTLSELLSRSNSDTITHRGRVIRSVVHVPVQDGARVRIERKSVGSHRPQALKVGLQKGVLDVNGMRAPAVALWSHTSPDVVEVVVRSGTPTTLDVWNAWSMGGVDSSWVGNAGIVSRTTDHGQLLQCSDGIGPATFSDLVATVDIVA